MVTILKSNSAIQSSMMFFIVVGVLLLASIKQTDAQQQGDTSGAKPSASTKARQPTKTTEYAHAQNADWIERGGYGGVRNVIFGFVIVVGVGFVVFTISNKVVSLLRRRAEQSAKDRAAREEIKRRL